MIPSQRFILTFAALVFGTAAIMSTLAVRELEVYYSLYVIEFLLLLELLGTGKKSLSRELTPVAIALFLAFAYVIAWRVIQILT
jgi:hypothetical protein